MTQAFRRTNHWNTGFCANCKTLTEVQTIILPTDKPYWFFSSKCDNEEQFQKAIDKSFDYWPTWTIPADIDAQIQTNFERLDPR